MFRCPFAGVAVLAALLVAACGADGAADDGPIVVATTTQIAALVREVAGDTVELHTLLGVGADPHHFDPSPQDVARIGGARLVLRNGLGLDDALNDAIAGSGAATVVTVTDGIEPRPAAREEHEDDDHEGDDHGDLDPHVWHDPTNAQVMLANVVDALVEAFPDHASDYRSRGQAYATRLDEVDAEIRALVDAIPAEHRKVVSSHDSLGYFLDRYGLEFVGAVIPAQSGDAEASARDIADLEETIRREGVRAIFAEGSVDARVGRQVAADTGVAIVDDLYGDSLGEPGSGAETLDGMLLHNARRIAEALQ